VIVIARTAVKRLVEKGEVDVWTPRGTNAPRGNIVHVVRTSSSGDTFCHAKLKGTPREAVLQDLTYPDALHAGFQSRERFYEWWRKRHATGPLMSELVLCWASSYSRVDVEIPQFLAAGGGYTSQPFLSVDRDQREGFRDTPLSAVTESHYLRQWAGKAEEDRLAKVNERKAAWKADWRERRRQGREAA
jgi:hypothetical protein